MRIAAARGARNRAAHGVCALSRHRRADWERPQFPPRGGRATLLPMSPLSPTPLSTLPSLTGVEARRPLGLEAPSLGGAALLRAEVEPEARGLGVAAHAARVLDALLPTR